MRDFLVPGTGICERLDAAPLGDCRMIPRSIWTKGILGKLVPQGTLMRTIAPIRPADTEDVRRGTT